jgi:hypothetical protein
VSTASGSTPIMVSQSAGVLLANSSIAAMVSGTESHGQLTTRITVTSTILVTPEATVIAMAKPFTDAPQQASSVQVIRAMTKTPAPDTTRVIYQLFRPESESAPQFDQSSDTKNRAITGAIVGSVSLVVIVLMLLAVFRGRWHKPSKLSRAEEGRSGHPDQRSTNDVIEEAHRRRKDRNRRSREKAVQLSAVEHGRIAEPTKAQRPEHCCANSQISPKSNSFDSAHLPG